MRTVQPIVDRLLETDALTPNGGSLYGDFSDDFTEYVVDPENLDYLVETILTIKEEIERDGATLIINHWESRCSACKKNADPAEDAHYMRRMDGDGCGAVYIDVSSDYFGMEDNLRKMRPDLAVVLRFNE